MNNRGRLVALLLSGAVLAGCQQAASTQSESTQPPKESPTMNLDQLPTLKETIPPMLDLADAVRREISRQVPATAPWRWVDEFSSDSCEQGGTSLYFPGLYSDHAFSEAEWAQVLPAVTRLAADAGLTGGNEGPMNKPGNHDVNFTSDDGRRLRFGSRDATLVRPYLGCRRPGEDLWVDGRIPMPPAPQP